MPNGPTAFTAKLVLSDNATVEAILTDIPFFCVGILAFGLSTFVLFMKRFHLIALYLYSSALLAFGSAILDLSQVLARDHDSQAFDENGLNSIVNTREVGFSLALGLRFLFYWTFVSQRPQGEPPPPLRVDLKTGYDVREHFHSGDWRRWGYIGFILQWSLLTLTISIPILEMVWRLAARQYGTVYVVDNTFIIVVASLFILKLCLNVFLSPVSPWWHVSRWYGIPITALLINLGIGAGNLTSFAFSETTLGRFFQAMELYLLMLFVLLSTFYKQRSSSQSEPASRETKSAAFLDDRKDADTSLSTGSQLKTLPLGVVVGTPPRPFDLRASRASSWIFGRGVTRRSVSQGWGRGDIEQGGMSATTPQPGPKETNINTVDGTSDMSIQPRLTAPPIEKVKLGAVSTRPITDVSLASYYQMDQTARLSFPTAVKMAGSSRNGSDSPVYGLNGIMRPESVRSSKQSVVSGRASMSSFEELLRQQGELDKSIATLRLFSPQAIEPERKAPIPPTPKPRTSRGVSTSTNSWAARGLDSASARSEFSLSIFPEPPTTGEPVPALNPDETPLNRGASKRLAGDESPSVPSSPHQAMTSRFASNGTQYDVTSFIGDLTVPIGEQGRPASSFKRADRIDSKEESALAGPTLASAGTPTPLGPATASSGLLTALSGAERGQTRRISTVPVVSSPLANPFHPRNPITVPVGPRGPLTSRAPTASASSARPPGARLNISGPRLQASDGRGEQPFAFERPRPPPLLLGQEK